VLEKTGPAGMPLCGLGDPTWRLRRHSTGERASAHHDLDTRHEGTVDTAVNQEITDSQQKYFSGFEIYASE